MLLQDSIQVNVSAETVFGFFEEMADNYVAWHPDHIAFRWIEGESVTEGAVFYFEEIIAGELQKKRMRFTQVQPGRFLEFEPVNRMVRLLMPRLSFEMEPIDATSCYFRAKIHLRVGPLAARLNAKEFTAVRQHMKEEGENLKRMVEAKHKENVAA